MENKEISQQLRILKSQPLSQSSCASIIEVLKVLEKNGVEICRL